MPQRPELHPSTSIALAHAHATLLSPNKPGPCTRPTTITAWARRAFAREQHQARAGHLHAYACQCSKEKHLATMTVDTLPLVSGHSARSSNRNAGGALAVPPLGGGIEKPSGGGAALKLPHQTADRSPGFLKPSAPMPPDLRALW